MTGQRNGTRALTLAAIALILCGGIFAQQKSREERREEANSRSVMGTVTSPDDKAVSGAVVQLKDMRTLQVRSFITLDDGQYHFSGLRNDIDYELSARSGDMTATKKLSLFDNRKEAVLNFKFDKK
ncbi:MAG: carboxypeptidase-like regulatory domain-containing protein [Acidobacteriota bacterium]